VQRSQIKCMGSHFLFFCTSYFIALLYNNKLKESRKQAATLINCSETTQSYICDCTKSKCQYICMCICICDQLEFHNVSLITYVYVFLHHSTQEEMAHTCRGTVNLAGAFIDTIDSCNFVITNGPSQVFHLRAINEVERQRWVTALELAKAKAIKMLESGKFIVVLNNQKICVM